MPELPEVENVRLSLERQGIVGDVILRIELRREGLRTPFARDLASRLAGHKIMHLRRRAKFLLIETETHVLLSHLGMSGFWREDDGSELKHDHVVLHLGSGRRLIFNDPRRFSVLEAFPREREPENRWLQHLGIEPLDVDFNGERLFQLTRKRKVPIKVLLMDQRRVVGVGNIYASEALFRAGVRPGRAAARITRVEATRITDAIQLVLRQAIAKGGSTIRDYRNSEGNSGGFQAEFYVYDRAGKPCLVCGTPIRSRFLAARNTFWCPNCQT